jgi:3-hydroxybutyryl-CoA dehydrogenase
VDNTGVDFDITTAVSSSRARVTVLGAGMMGSQIAYEYALAGHDVTVVARDEVRARERLGEAARVARDVRPSGDGVDVAVRYARSPQASDLIVESLPEDFDLKVSLLTPHVLAAPEAMIASNTSSLGIGRLAEALQAQGRTFGTHYWNPPLLMPLVEVVAPSGSEADRLSLLQGFLVEMGKRPVVVKDVPGFAWNRLQFALLREAVALVEAGVVTAEGIDEIVRDGLARRWTLTGPFQTLALGGSATFESIAANLYPALSAAREPGELAAYDTYDEAEKTELRRARDQGLAALLHQAPMNGVRP